MNWREVKTIADAFEWSALPPNIPRMTFRRADEVGYPVEVVEHLELDEIDYVPDRDRLLFLATLTRLCTLEDQIERGELTPLRDVVLRKEHDALLKRFRHLLKSDFIRSFDEYDPRTQTYKRDITEADVVASPVRCKDCVHYDNRPYDWTGPRYCECLGCYRQGDFFCAYGRKREVIRDE